MAENTRQYEAVVTLKGNIEAFTPRSAFVAGDHLIYVDPTDPTERQAPDVYVAFGRPRGHRGSYKLWDEDGVFPQVVFEVLGPSNTPKEMAEKRQFYFGHGAEEYYEFDPEAGTWTGFAADPSTGAPEPVPNMDGHVSPRLGMRFAFRPMELLVFRPDGSRFLSFQELNDRAEDERRRAETAEQRAEAERRRAEDERRRAETAEQRAEDERRRAETSRQELDVERRRAERQQAEADRLRTLLRAAGLDPDPPAVP
jgi:Uma2 family endonuclease